MSGKLAAIFDGITLMSAAESTMNVTISFSTSPLTKYFAPLSLFAEQIRTVLIVVGRSSKSPAMESSSKGERGVDGGCVDSGVGCVHAGSGCVDTEGENEAAVGGCDDAEGCCDDAVGGCDDAVGGCDDAEGGCDDAVGGCDD